MAFGQLTHRECLSDTALCLSLQRINFIIWELAERLINLQLQEPMRIEIGEYSVILRLISLIMHECYMRTTI